MSDIVNSVSRTLIALALLAAATWLAWLDPALRSQVEGAILVGAGSASGYFFTRAAFTAQPPPTP